ncbi:tRNA pseudouridine(55) synthase TruB [Peptoniphilus sp. KCTC 25270]|uniref:tRNA pseudouridine(55) synthase TruB n=1 Tax=Peptoniphilus sp. KCTC 25270 TaxID=2897414 RepID=UPI001E55EEF6|nr:tRNA pseudouridine(55) synthase TruB [Peptoniphilus sp. KCTC 25270]MCD1146992.1 tRNA pseudouridine(55) synthase TruB [Peptoniphilus sp. KCTC 25270]
MEGILLIYKEKDWTSHDVVAKVRRIYNTKKVGHTGTLDPMATGLLPICIGRATKLADYISQDRKAYIASADFGYQTNTYDITGEVTEKSDSIHLEELDSVFENYLGEIHQIPPMFSAIKVNGKKLYEYARKGMEIERKSRKVTIYSLKILERNSSSLKFYVECSSGTYIRSLIDSMGKDLGCYATMTDLERVSVGEFDVKEAIPISELEKVSEEERIELLKPLDQAIQFLPRVNISNQYRKYALNGRAIPVKNLPKEKIDSYRVYLDNEFIGLGFYTKENGQAYFRMKKVII